MANMRQLSSIHSLAGHVSGGRGRSARSARAALKVAGVLVGLTLVLSGCATGEGAEASTPDATSASTPDATSASTPDATSTASAPNEGAEPGAATPATPAQIDGTWCPAPDSPDTEGCVTIALPTAKYEARTAEIRHISDQDGCFVFTAADAPFGAFCPAGVRLDVPSYYAGVDYPEQDRIWNGQVGSMLLRG